MKFMQALLKVISLAIVVLPCTVFAAPMRIGMHRRQQGAAGTDAQAMYMSTLNADVGQFVGSLQAMTQSLKQDDDALGKAQFMVVDALDMANGLYQPQQAAMILPDLVNTIQNIVSIVVEQNDDTTVRSQLKVIVDNLVKLSIDLHVPVNLMGVTRALSDQQQP
ncbi:hypothetical protein BC940DRAFT_306527 [Gongronella butleri]|nr:hypothetical protein BC940DRAFT_306527 [Gongronella butleri]